MSREQVRRVCHRHDVDAMDIFQLRSKPRRGSHIQGAHIAHHAAGREDFAVDVVVRHVPVHLYVLDGWVCVRRCDLEGYIV